VIKAQCVVSFFSADKWSLVINIVWCSIFRRKAFSGGFPSIGFAFLGIGIVFILIGKRKSWPLRKRFFGFFMAGFALLWSSLAFWMTGSEYFEAKSAYRTHTYSVVEGPVSNFHPMPIEGHQDECFSVQSARFCYSDYVVTAGFNNSASHGGPIREGLPVRVSYIDDIILRLEVRDSEKKTSR
jgi:4-amino-4-deoxy-L-arabinose transferase-like glycosyltransferase